jgi:hypothetical protein
VVILFFSYKLKYSPPMVIGSPLIVIAFAGIVAAGGLNDDAVLPVETLRGEIYRVLTFDVDVLFIFFTGFASGAESFELSNEKIHRRKSFSAKRR